MQNKIQQIKKLLDELALEDSSEEECDCPTKDGFWCGRHAVGYGIPKSDKQCEHKNTNYPHSNPIQGRVEWCSDCYKWIPKTQKSDRPKEIRLIPEVLDLNYLTLKNKLNEVINHLNSLEK